jgi:hypothetical protein
MKLLSPPPSRLPHRERVVPVGEESAFLYPRLGVDGQGQTPICGETENKGGEFLLKVRRHNAHAVHVTDRADELRFEFAASRESGGLELNVFYSAAIPPVDYRWP